MQSPLDFPPLTKAVIPGDKVVLAMDTDFPEPGPVVKMIYEQLAAAGVHPEDITLIQEERPDADLIDPRADLPSEIREAVHWMRHKPDDADACRYLATTTGGERIYLAGCVVDADVVVTLGQMSFDPLLGFRGTHSVFYPGLSNREAHLRSRGQGHGELTPEHDRPWRQLIDEIGWLVGTQFTVQVIPAIQGGVARVLAGSAESVLREGKLILRDLWSCQLEERADLVVAAIESSSPGQGWHSLGAVLGCTRNLVARDGKILILTNLNEAPGEGVQMVRGHREPADAIQTLRAEAPTDLITATELALATDWANVYLMSDLPGDLVEDLFMIPIENQREAARVIEGENSCVFLDSAQFVHGSISG
ncbi:MAG: hypothetical protein Tsb009_14580 [Planctomycetaceae bacterium]